MKTRALLATLALLAIPMSASALISGTSTVSMCSEAGNWIDLAFTSDTPVTLVDAHWDFTATSVWLDRDGTSVCTMQNNGVTSFAFYFDDPPGVDTQTFGLTATGFDSGDYFRFVMDLDIGGGGSPFTTDYYGATIRVEFSDGTVLNATFDEPYESPSGATAGFIQPRANLMFDAKAGWYAPVVPRPAADATYASTPAPTSLIGDGEATWFNSLCRNTGDTWAGQSHMSVFVDAQPVVTHALWLMNPGEYNGWMNDGPIIIRGGRHTVKAVCDVLGEVSESDETDNVHARQWIWGPATLPLEQVVTRAAPPLNSADTQYLTSYWWNCDGLRFVPQTARPWSTVWIEALSGLNPQYTLRVHPAATGPENGFGTNYGASPMTEHTRAVIVNTRLVPQVPYDVGILNYGGAGNNADYRIAHICNSPYPFDFGIEPEAPYSGSRLLTFELHVDAGDLGPATLTLYSNPGDGAVHMGWLASTFTYGSLGDLQGRVTTDAEGLARIDLNLTVTGDYLAVVYCNRDEHPATLTANVGLYKARPDLEPTILSGWFAPIVPRPAADAALLSCPLPDALQGNAAATWMNVACLNGGTDVADTVSFGISVDGGFTLGLRNLVTPLAAGLPRALTNLMRAGVPWDIPGGRHTLSVETDYLEELAELCERNNLGGRQYCWSPLGLSPGVSIARPTLPAKTGGWDQCDDPEPLAYNCDGLRLPWSPLGSDGWWRAVAVMPPTSTTDVDARLHAELSGTRTGFGATPLVESAWGTGELDFVMVDYNDAAATAYDVGVVHGGTVRCTYTAEETVSDWFGIDPAGEWGPYTMAPGHMLHLYEMRLSAGLLLLRVDNLGDAVDWGVSLYSRGDPFLGKSDAIAGGIAWQAGAGGSESIWVNVPTSDFYCLAVWKARAVDLATNGSYRLWLTPGATSAPTPQVPRATRIVAAAPNPFNPVTSIAFDLRHSGPCVVEVYDVQGRLVRRLFTGDLIAGRHEARWDGLDGAGRPVASGVYIAQLAAAGVRDHHKLTLAR